MDLSLSGTQLMVQKAVRTFAREALEEWANVLDRESRPLPRELVAEMGRINLWGIQAPERFGGAGLDTISYAIAVEEISRVSAAVGLGVTVHNSVCLAPLLKFGSPEQIGRYAADLAGGRKIGGFTVTEPQAGSDAASIRTTAVPDGDDYLISGQKAFVTNGGTGDLFLVAATLDPRKKARGIAIFIVEKSMPGFEVGKIEDMMGMRGNMVSELYFDRVRVPKLNILGRPEDGFKISMQTLDMGRIGIAAQAIDGGTGHVGCQLSELLGMPLVTRIHRFHIEENHATIERIYGHEYQKIRAALPLLFAVGRDDNRVRFALLADIAQSAGALIEELSMDDIGGGRLEYGGAGSPTVVIDTHLFTHTRSREPIAGSAAEKADALVQRLRKHDILRY